MSLCLYRGSRISATTCCLSTREMLPYCCTRSAANVTWPIICSKPPHRHGVSSEFGYYYRFVTKENDEERNHSQKGDIGPREQSLAARTVTWVGHLNKKQTGQPGITPPIQARAEKQGTSGRDNELDCSDAFQSRQLKAAWKYGLNFPSTSSDIPLMS